MRRSWPVVVLIGVCWVQPTVASAGWGGSSDDGTVSVWASSDAVITSGGSGGRACRWDRLTKGQVIGLAPSQGPLTMTHEELQQPNSVEIGGVEFALYSVSCADAATLRLVRVSRDPSLLFEPVRDYAEGLIAAPEPDLSPSVSGGGFVNLGMWLAVAPVTYEPITAEAGLAWITVRPRLAETRFEMGAGEVEVCAGFGTPIVELDTFDEGECGFTYRAPGTYTVTVTSVWELPYTSSGGAGALPAIERSGSFAYTVREIQTVGVSG